MPERILRRRTKGWRMPEGAVYVGRGTKWGNPFKIGEDARDRKHAVELYEAWVDLDARELAGKDLACWCPLDEPCHAYVLLKLANDPKA